MVVTAFNHAAHKLYGRIIFLPVVLALRFYHYFAEGIFGRRKRHFIRCVTGRTDGTDIVIITDYRDDKHCFGTVGFEIETSVASGSSSFCRVF